MSEAVLADKWLYAILHGDATLLAAAPGDVWPRPAPPEVSGIFVTYQFIDGRDVVVMGGHRVMTNCLYDVVATVQADTYADLETATDRIDTLLHDTIHASLAGGMVVDCMRVGPIRYPETTEGLSYRNLGGQYRLHVREE